MMEISDKSVNVMQLRKKYNPENASTNLHFAHHRYLSVNVNIDVTCSPRDPRYAGSNPTEVDGLFQDVKILNTSPPGGTLSSESRV